LKILRTQQLQVHFAQSSQSTIGYCIKAVGVPDFSILFRDNHAPDAANFITENEVHIEEYLVEIWKLSECRMTDLALVS
jgi:hypothetical protein